MPELLNRIVASVRGGIVAGRLKEWLPSDDEDRAHRELLARASLVGHYSEYFGETVSEFNPMQPVDGRPGFIVVEHKPMPARPYWTYATAGLSLWEQRPEEPQGRVEFLAYSPQESQSVVDVLMVMGRQIHLLEETDRPYKAFDTVTLPGVGLVNEMFVLAPPMEAPDLLAFPDVVRNARFIHTVTGNLEDSVAVAFIQVVPVLPDELDFAIKSGTPELLAKMNLAKRGKDFGWGRNERASVLRKGFFGLFN